jgi:ribosomal protein S18 acetylase RimI-like enzyme
MSCPYSTRMITYTDSLDGITPEQLQGFFIGWPDPPTPETHLRILHGSSHVELALDIPSPPSPLPSTSSGHRPQGEGRNAGKVVGFMTAISDGVSAAYIPHLEVLPDYQGQGIGSELARRMVDKLRDLYMIDLMCDSGLQPFYQRLGMRPYTGMMIRNYDRQSGK